MSQKEYLRADVAALIPTCVSDDLTVNVDGVAIFLTNVFKDGTLLGFWSHSPCGRVQDQEVGWMLISPTGECLDSVETRSYGVSPGQDYKRWRAAIRKEHGSSKRLCDEFTLENIWRLADT